eukprot:jgi/Astpho2/3519/Aster-06432
MAFAQAFGHSTSFDPPRTGQASKLRDWQSCAPISPRIPAEPTPALLQSASSTSSTASDCGSPPGPQCLAPSHEDPVSVAPKAHASSLVVTPTETPSLPHSEVLLPAPVMQGLSPKLAKFLAEKQQQEEAAARPAAPRPSRREVPAPNREAARPTRIPEQAAAEQQQQQHHPAAAWRAAAAAKQAAAVAAHSAGSSAQGSLPVEAPAEGCAPSAATEPSPAHSAPVRASSADGIIQGSHQAPAKALGRSRSAAAGTSRTTVPRGDAADATSPMSHAEPTTSAPATWMEDAAEAGKRDCDKGGRGPAVGPATPADAYRAASAAQAAAKGEVSEAGPGEVATQAAAGRRLQAGQRVWFRASADAPREAAVVLAPSPGSGRGLTLIHLDSNKKVFSAAPRQLESMETGEDAPAGSRVWCKRKDGTQLSGIVVTADPAARAGKAKKAGDSIVYVGDEAIDILNRVSTGCFHASSGHIIGLEAVMEERDAGSKKETAPTDVGHLCAAPTFMPLLPPPAPQTPAKAAERRASGGLPTSTSASCSAGVDGVPPLMESDPRPESEAGSLQTASSAARILRMGSDSSASSSAPAPALGAAAAEEDGELALDPSLDDPLLEEDVPCGFVFGPFRMRILAYEILPGASMVYWELQPDGTAKRCGPMPSSPVNARLAGLCDVQQSYFEVLAETLDSPEEMQLEVSEDNDPAVMLAGLQEACELIMDSISGATQRQT